MRYLSDDNELNKLIRKLLIEQTEIPADRVINGLSVYGETLDKLIAKNRYDSYNRDDLFIIFELSSRNSESNMSYTKDDDTLEYIGSYNMHVIIYGNSSSLVASKLAARMRTETVRDVLDEDSTYVENVSDPTTVNEFVNGVLWHRADVDIYLSCTFNFNQIGESQSYDSLSKLTIKETD